MSPALPFSSHSLLRKICIKSVWGRKAMEGAVSLMPLATAAPGCPAVDLYSSTSSPAHPTTAWHALLGALFICPCAFAFCLDLEAVPGLWSLLAISELFLGGEVIWGRGVSSSALGLRGLVRSSLPWMPHSLVPPPVAVSVLVGRAHLGAPTFLGFAEIFWSESQIYQDWIWIFFCCPSPPPFP